MTQGEADLVAWRCFEDTVRRWLPSMDISMLQEVAADLRPGSGGPWEGMSGDLEARRVLLLADVVEVGSSLLGGPWPILGDELPAAPDSPAGLAS